LPSQEAGLERYAIAGQESDWSDALVGGKQVPKSGLLSVKRKAGEKGEDFETPAKEKKDKKDNKGSASKGKDRSGKKSSSSKKASR
tara:strand:+ start:218 stop:475 length:258 start_codon:yes stop_codon:yes gene_type:complete